MALLCYKEKALLKSALGSVLSQQENSFVFVREKKNPPTSHYWTEEEIGSEGRENTQRCPGSLVLKLRFELRAIWLQSSTPTQWPHCLWSFNLSARVQRKALASLDLLPLKPPDLVPPIPEGKRQLLKMINKKMHLPECFLLFPDFCSHRPLTWAAHTVPLLPLLLFSACLTSRL